MSSRPLLTSTTYDPRLVPAADKLQELLGIDEVGASAILDLQFRRLSARERKKLIEDRDQLIRERQRLDE